MNPTSVRRALYGKLAGDTTLNALLASPPTGYSKAIFYQLAPEGAHTPYVVFQKQAGTPGHTMQGGANSWKSDIWAIKGVTTDTSADVSESIASRLDDLLSDASLSISSEALMWLRSEGDISYAEVTAGVTYQHAGLNFRLVHQHS